MLQNLSKNGCFCERSGVAINAIQQLSEEQKKAPGVETHSLPGKFLFQALASVGSKELRSGMPMSLRYMPSVAP